MAGKPKTNKYSPLLPVMCETVEKNVHVDAAYYSSLELR